MNPNQQPQQPNTPQPPQYGAPTEPQPYQPQPQAQPQFGQPSYPPQPSPYASPQTTAQPQFVPQARPTSAAPMPGMPQGNQADFSPDYLDQIAPGPSGAKFFSGNFTWILIGLALVFMFAVGLITLNSGGGNTIAAQTVYMRYDYFLKTIPTYTRHLKSSKLSATATDFRVFMTGAQHDLLDPLSKNGIVNTGKDISKELKAKEKAHADEVGKKLEEAKLNAILDRVYARELAYQTGLILDQYKKMEKTKSKALIDNAKKAITNLEPIRKSFAEFNETGGQTKTTD